MKQLKAKEGESPQTPAESAKQELTKQESPKNSGKVAPKDPQPPSVPKKRNETPAIVPVDK